MADYCSPTVVEPMIPMAGILPIEAMFLSQIFTEDAQNGTAYYCSEHGASDLVFLNPSKVREALAATDPGSSRLAALLLADHKDAIEGDEDIELGTAGDLWPDVLQDIVRRSSDIDHVTITMAFTCSKMRPDGFGGLAMLITADKIRSESTHTMFERFYSEAAANGEIRHGDS
jgi:hypothetical protein